MRGRFPGSMTDTCISSTAMTPPYDTSDNVSIASSGVGDAIDKAVLETGHGCSLTTPRSNSQSPSNTPYCLDGLCTGSKPKTKTVNLTSEIEAAQRQQHRYLQQCTISWQHVSYILEPKKRWFKRSSQRPETQEPRKILNSVWGRSGPGELTAIIGPSGAGKTTLLDILADRVPNGGPGVRVEGFIDVNGQPRDPRTFHSIMNYVSQDMAFLGSFSVLETLQIAAGLGLPSYVPILTRESRVQDVIDAMGLRSCMHANVGDVFHKGISSGQRKRLGIAVELLSDPALLLLDEPTSGLDASSARSVMQHIERLCQEEGKNVICTIHQPSSSVYEMLTNLIILSDGQLVYFGPAAAALNHFFSMGYVCPMYSNPAEYFVHLVNVDFHSKLRLEPFVRALQEGTEPQRLHVDVARDRSVRDLNLVNYDMLRAMRPSRLDQFGVLLHRNLTNNWRHPGVFWIRVLMYVLLSFMVGTMYLSSNQEITSSAMVPLLFYVQAFLVFMSVAALPALLEQRAVLEREVRSHALHLASYTTANLLGALPGIMFISLLASCIVVYFARVHSFGSFFLNLTLSLITSESMMHLLGAAVPHYIMGIALGAGLFGMFMLCEGFMVPFAAIPAYWKWGYYMAFHTYSFESFMYEHFSNVDTPEAWELLESYGMQNVNVTRNMLILVGYAAGLQLLSIMVLVLRFGRHKR
ncbi:ABC transporter G family member 13 [Phytophthora citrophthora]|uniref:ABC transporter G family member 13 n=1 Tax=Phytophthora citrophthora TaxID=4793 RepID=A0AAD9G2B2_9STRA|nr:ABC transporter G family member 13 [Phytophthora citrophthora]